MTSFIPYSKHAGGITAFINGAPVIFPSDSVNYDLAEQALKAKNWAEVIRLSSIKATIVSALKDAKEHRIFISEDNELIYEGPRGREVLHGTLVDRIMQSCRDEKSSPVIRPLMALLSNISRNKLKDIRAELYEFLMSGKAPITEDGCFLAFKKVCHVDPTKNIFVKAPKGAKFVDIFTKTMDNSPGVLVAMDETKVDTNRDNTCSVGLHFCTRNYLSNYSSSGLQDVVVVVKVNPRHVFAIPSDYQNAKGRASEYYVVGVCTGDPHKDDLFLKPFIMNDKPEVAVSGVEFVVEDDDTGNKPLKAGMKTIARGYGYLNENDKIMVHVRNTKGDFEPAVYAVCCINDKGEYISTRTKKAVPMSQIQLMSYKTKSAYAALVRAVAKRRGSI